MTAVVVAGLFALIMCGLAVRADVRFRDAARLPMQWWLNGDVTWWAPRRLALAFIPIVAIGVLAVFAIMLLAGVQPRAGQDAQTFPALIGIGVMFVAIQLVHFRLIARTLRRGAD